MQSKYVNMANISGLILVSMEMIQNILITHALAFLSTLDATKRSKHTDTTFVLSLT